MLQPDAAQRKTAEDLVVTIDLPGVPKGAAKLDVSVSQLRIFAPAPPPADGRPREFRLTLTLVKKVRSAQARATFRSTAQQPVVTLPPRST